MADLRVFSTGHQENQAREIEQLREARDEYAALARRRRDAFVEAKAENERLREAHAERLREIGELQDLLGDVLASGVVLDDERIRYLTVQIDRPTWNEIREAVKHEETNPDSVDS